MKPILLASAVAISLGQDAARAIDVSVLKIGPSARVAELDLGKLKGDLRQIAWSTDGSQLYVQTADGDGPSAKLRHYMVAAVGGVPHGVDTAPEWAETYWAFKSDRAAPGIGSLMIDVEQKLETVKIGTGSAGALDRSSNGLGADNINSGANLERAAEGQKQNVIRLTLFGEAVGEFVNQRPIPGLTFSWGPSGSGAIVYADRDGRLLLLDQNKHKRMISGAKDAVLPAWSTDGMRLAWAQKAGRRKYTLMAAPIAK
jgi:hypothetical protein